MLKRIFIVEAKRSAIGTFGGGLMRIPAPEIASNILKNIIENQNISVSAIQEVIVGNTLMAGQGMGPARQVSLGAGLDNSVPACTVNMMCGSGMKAVMIGAGNIMLGHADFVAAGGMENMSRAPYLLPFQTRWGKKIGDLTIKDSILLDGLTDCFLDTHMGVTAENIAEKHQISRPDQDYYALLSQKRVASAIKSGYMAEEIVPQKIGKAKSSSNPQNQQEFFDIDEHPRPEINKEALSSLKPAFKKNGTVTAGNSSGINDGAAMLLLASEKALEHEGVKPMAELLYYTQVGVDPGIMGMAPAMAIERILGETGMNLRDIGALEINEAFAAQTLGVVRQLSHSCKEKEESIIERLNVNGGAIALGHPIGASGARIMVTLIHEMRRKNIEHGIASLCIGGGMGTAVLVRTLQAA